MNKNVPIEIVSVIEPWATATLSDGTVIKAKIIFVSAVKVLNENNGPLLNPDGSQVYNIAQQVIMSVISPENAKALKIQRN